MGEHDAIEKAQVDHELRLRSSEKALNVLKGQIDQIVANVEDIKTRIAFLTTGTATQEHLHRVEDSVRAAHKRLDEFNKELWKLQAEHSNCLRVRDDTVEAINAIKDVLTTLKIDVNKVQQTVGEFQKDKDAVTNFFSGRLGALVDRGLQFLPWVAMYLWYQYQLSPTLKAMATSAHVITK